MGTEAFKPDINNAAVEEPRIVDRWKSSDQYNALKRELKEGVEGNMTPEKKYYNLVKDVYFFASTTHLPWSEIPDLLSASESFREFKPQRNELRAAGVSDEEIEKYSELFKGMEERFLELQRKTEEAGKFVHPDVRRFIHNDMVEIMRRQLSDAIFEELGRGEGSYEKKQRMVAGVQKQHETFDRAEEERINEYREAHKEEFAEYELLDAFLKKSFAEERRIDDPEVARATERFQKLAKQLNSAGFETSDFLPWEELRRQLRSALWKAEKQSITIEKAKKEMQEAKEETLTTRQKMERIGLPDKP